MNNLENSIKDCIKNEIETGVIEKIIKEEFEGAIRKSIHDMFSYSGAVTKAIKDNLNSVMVPYLEEYDYSKYITKLDSVLCDVLKETSLENRKIMDNFKDLATSNRLPKVIKITDIFEEWNKHCENNIDRDKIEDDFEETWITTSFKVENVGRSWGGMEKRIVTFECEEDENLNFKFSIHSFDNDLFTSDYKRNSDIQSLKFLDKFEIFMMRVSEWVRNIEIDKTSGESEIYIEYEA